MALGVPGGLGLWGEMLGGLWDLAPGTMCPLGKTLPAGGDRATLTASSAQGGSGDDRTTRPGGEP